MQHHWAGRTGSENFDDLTTYTDAFRPGARRFDGGEASNFVLLPMAVAALQIVTDWSVERIQLAVEPLTRAVADGATALGLSAHVGPTAGHIVGLKLPPQSLTEVAQRLADAHIHVSVRGVNLRISPYVLNDLADVTHLLDTLAVAL